MGIRENMAVHAVTEKAGNLLEPLLEGEDDEESSYDDESSTYSSPTKSIEIKATPLQKLKFILGKFTVVFYARIMAFYSTYQTSPLASHAWCDGWGGGVCGGDNS